MSTIFVRDYPSYDVQMLLCVYSRSSMLEAQAEYDTFGF